MTDSDKGWPLPEVLKVNIPRPPSSLPFPTTAVTPPVLNSPIDTQASTPAVLPLPRDPVSNLYNNSASSQTEIVTPQEIKPVDLPPASIADPIIGTTQTRNPVISSNPKKKNGGRTLLFSGIILILVICLAGVTFLFIQNKQQNDVLQTTVNDLISELNETVNLLNDANEKLDLKEEFNSIVRPLKDNLRTNFSGTILSGKLDLNELTSAIDYMNGGKDFLAMEEMKLAVETAKDSTSQYNVLFLNASENIQTNSTGTLFETTIDGLSKGLVEVRWYREDNDEGCVSPNDEQGLVVVACVRTDSGPYVIWLNQDVHNFIYETGETSRADSLYGFVAFHEYMHSIQLTNLNLTNITADEFFNGDMEFFADCMGQALYGEGWEPSYENFCSAEQEIIASEFVEQLLFK